MEESASMLCARVVRGISSIEKEVTPVAAISWKVSTAPSGRRNPMRTWPAGRAGDRLCRCYRSSRSTAPALRYRPGQKPRRGRRESSLPWRRIRRPDTPLDAGAGLDHDLEPAFVRLGMTSGHHRYAPLPRESLRGTPTIMPILAIVRVNLQPSRIAPGAIYFAEIC